MRLEKIYEKYEVSEVYMLADSFQDLGKNVLNSCFYFQMWSFRREFISDLIFLLVFILDRNLIFI